MVRWVTIVLAVFGLGVALWAVAHAKEPKPELPLARPASVNPYASGVAALGIVEPTGKDVAVIAPESALITKVLVDVGDRVEPGQVLFELDSRRLEADLLRGEAGIVQAQSEIDRWHALPRAEDLPPLEAAVARSRAVLADAADRRANIERAQSAGGANDRELSAARFGEDAARAELARAEADLARARAGGWKPDLAISQANLDRQKAEVAALRVLMDRMKVRAPRAGTILRREVEVGEFAVADSSRPSMILGDLDRLSVRAQVDEEDIALVRMGADGGPPRAALRTRGSVVTEIPLKLVRIEPYARPKNDLAGTNSERVDTRVIDVLFTIEKTDGVALYPGQAVDVFIEAGK